MTDNTILTQLHSDLLNASPEQMAALIEEIRKDNPELAESITQLFRDRAAKP